MHRLLSKDTESNTGVCSQCGPVTLYRRMSQGKPQHRCSIAVVAQRDSPNRSKNWHGVPSAEAQEMKKDAACGLCGHTEKLVIDHCHETGAVRGILCQWCNSGLGFFRDRIDLLAAGIDYLHKAKTPATEVTGAAA